jgi:hypothetical protein
VNADRLQGAHGVARPSSDRAPLSFAFTLTRDEHLRAFDDLHPLHWWQLVSWITAPGGNATRRAKIWMAGALLLVVGVPLLFVRAAPKTALIGPTLVAIGSVWMALLRALRRRAAAATYDRSAALRSEQHWRLSDVGLEIEYGEPAAGGAHVTKLAWREVTRIEETRDGFGFVVSLERTGVLPRRAIGAGEWPRVRELLAQVRSEETPAAATRPPPSG